MTIDGLQIAKILHANYSGGVPFLTINQMSSNRCLCFCIVHPHCLSISVISSTISMSICQLFATYPMKSSQLSISSTSFVWIYVDRTINSTYVNNGNQLTNPISLFSNETNRWIPIFKLYTGNNQSFLWLNSSNLIQLTAIPTIAIDQFDSHWFNILLTQWTSNSYIPNQVALAFIVNRTNLFEFLIFNSSQTDLFNWFTISRLISRQYWNIYLSPSTMNSQLQMKATYTDDFSIRSFNANFKSTTGCAQDFYGFFFVYGGFRDVCLAAAVRNSSQLVIPTIFYSPTMTATNGNLSDYFIADGLMGFVR